MLPRARPWNSTCRLLASASTRLSPYWVSPRPSCGSADGFSAVPLIFEVDVLDERDLAVFVAHDVVAAQAVAVLVEAVSPFDALPPANAEQCIAHLLGLGAFRCLDGTLEQEKRVVGPARIDVGVQLVAGSVILGERLRFTARAGAENGYCIGAI